MTPPLARFERALRDIERSRRAIVSPSGLKRRDLDFVYQGLFLFAVRQFESYLEDQLVALACGAVQWVPRKIDGKLITVRPTLSAVSESRVRTLMLGSNDYLKLLPINYCAEMAEMFLKDGRPFSLIVGDDKGRLTRCLAVRNLIAHDSEAAKRKFADVVLNQTNLPPHRRNAAGFLQANFSKQQTFFEFELAGLLRIAQKLA